MLARLFAVVVVGVAAAAAAPYPVYPPDVETFIERVARCTSTQKEHLVLPEKYWACDKLETDKKPLLVRYRDRPELIKALNGHWVIEVKRIPTHIEN